MKSINWILKHNLIKLGLLKKRIIILTNIIVVLAAVVVSGWIFSIPKQALVRAESLRDVENPIARIILSKFFPNPNLLVEDYAEISCTPEFSIKVFTGSELENATFVVKDAGTEAVIFGPKVVPEIKPLWQKVWLGPLSSIPPKIHVIMDAQTPDGQLVSQKLILEPDCKKLGGVITKKVVILWPKGKILINLFPPLAPPETPRFFDIPLTVALPNEAIGQDLIAVVVWKNPETRVQQYISAHKLTDIPTEILQLDLQSISPVPNASFFDVFVKVGVGKEMGPGLIQALEIGKLIADAMEKIGRGDVVLGKIPEVQVDPKDGIDHPNGQRTFFQSTFDETYMSVASLSAVDAAPLEKPCALDKDCDGVGDRVDNCPSDSLNDADGDGICGDVDSCPADSTNTCRAAGVAGLADTTSGGN